MPIMGDIPLLTMKRHIIVISAPRDFDKDHVHIIAPTHETRVDAIVSTGMLYRATVGQDSVPIVPPWVTTRPGQHITLHFYGEAEKGDVLAALSVTQWVRE